MALVFSDIDTAEGQVVTRVDEDNGRLLIGLIRFNSVRDQTEFVPREGGYLSAADVAELDLEMNPL